MPRVDGEAGEFRLIADYLAGLDGGPGVVLGNGDDGAVLALETGEELVVSTDSAAEGVHFPLHADPARAAYRAVAAAASDLAAMGARPLAMTLSLSVPAPDEAWFAACRRGLAEAVRVFSLPLVGGDLVRAPRLLAVQVLGAVPAGRALRRAGARPGDDLFVSGCLGGSAAGLALLRGELAAVAQDRAELLGQFWRPRPCLALGQALRGRATAAIDVSDGLLADAAHLARASGVALHIESGALPLCAALKRCTDRARALRWALAGGEDYVLCFTLPAGEAAPEGCVRIGHVADGVGVHCDVAVDDPGFRHF